MQKAYTYRHMDYDNNNNDKNSNKDNNLSKTYLNDYLSKENKKLKRINKNYELLMIPLIEYINDLNYYFSQNLIDVSNINQIIKNNNLNENYTHINYLKSILNSSKNNIVNITKNNKRGSVNKNNISNFSNISLTKIIIQQEPVSIKELLLSI